MSPTTPYTAVVVAQGDSRQLLVTLLSLRQQARPDEVVVVDNATGLALEPLVRVSQLSARVIRLPERASLAAVCNAGLDAAAHEAVLFLPGGSRLEGDPATAAARLYREPDLAILGPVLYREDPPPRLRLHAGAPRGGELQAVTLPGMLVRRSDLRFDERYRSLGEDLDFCLRHRERGLRLAISDAYTVTCLQCSAVGGADTGVQAEVDLSAFRGRWGEGHRAAVGAAGNTAVLEAPIAAEDLAGRSYRAVRTLLAPHRGVPALAWTGERCVPEVMDQRDSVLAEHLARYRWAAELVRERYPRCTVLDIPCGAGYGSAMLAQLPNVSRVTGVDIDPETVEYARDRYGYLDPLRFEVGNLELPQEPADVVVCFEGIEHVADQRAAARSLCGALRPGGTLLVSTPNADRIVSSGCFHTHELTHAELVSLFAPHLESWTVHGQAAEVGYPHLERARYLILEGRVAGARTYR